MVLQKYEFFCSSKVFFFLSIFVCLCYNSENQHSESDFFNLTASNNLYLKYIFLKNSGDEKKNFF